MAAYSSFRRLFQPTLPARGATRRQDAAQSGAEDFNPRSPHGERRVCYDEVQPCPYFNPRSPHGERRAADDQRVAAVGISTHAPRTGSDINPATMRGSQGISTHAPRTGSDGIVMPQGRTRADFNPRSPHGERPAEGTNEAA